MADFETVKGFLQELQLRIVAESPAEGLVIVEDEARGLKHLIVDCEAPILVFTQKILPVPACPGALFRRLLQMNRTLTHGAFVLDETAHHVLLHDTLALAHLDGNEVQGTIDAFSLALAEHGEELIALSRPGVA